MYSFSLIPKSLGICQKMWWVISLPAAGKVGGEYAVKKSLGDWVGTEEFPTAIMLSAIPGAESTEPQITLWTSAP